MDKEYEQVKNWVFSVKLVSPLKIQNKFKIDQERALAIFERLSKEGYIHDVGTVKKSIHASNQLKYFEDKKMEINHNVENTIKDTVRSIEESFNKRIPRKDYIQPLMVQRSHEFNEEDDMHFGLPIYSFISCCENNQKTLFISDQLSTQTAMYLLLEVMTGIESATLLSGEIEENQWPILIQGAASMGSWPGRIEQLPKGEKSDQAKWLKDQLNENFDIYIFDFEMYEEPKSLQRIKEFEPLYNLALEKNKKIIFRATPRR